MQLGRADSFRDKIKKTETISRLYIRVLGFHFWSRGNYAGHVIESFHGKIHFRSRKRSGEGFGWVMNVSKPVHTTSLGCIKVDHKLCSWWVTQARFRSFINQNQNGRSMRFWVWLPKLIPLCITNHHICSAFLSRPVDLHYWRSKRHTHKACVYL